MRKGMGGARTGSVMMEFLLVLPVYFALLGGTFAVGDLLMRSISLTYADRLRAMSPDEFEARSERAITHELVPFFCFEDDENMQSTKSDMVIPDGKTLRADEKFAGAWSWQSAGKVRDRYVAPMWTRSWIGFPEKQFEAAMSKANTLVQGKNLSEMLKDGLDVVSMDTERERHYNYYTLKRTMLGRTSYRSWHPKNLTNVPVDYNNVTFEDAIPVWGATWFKNVYREPFADSDPGKLDNLKSEQKADELPEEPNWRTEYSRFPTFMLWSQ